MPRLGIHSRGNLKKGMEPNMISTNKQNSPSIGYEVEDDVPVPPKKVSRKSKYPFGSMAINQSVLIPEKGYSAVIGVLRKHKNEGKKFVIRQVAEGFRVWRIG
jgi:hypothetical protein